MEIMNYKKLETYRSLLGLSVGDAAGENQMKLLPPVYYKAGNVAAGRDATPYWPWTDDCAMAVGLTEILFTYNTVKQIGLAKQFAVNFKADPMRGYGRGTYGLLKVFDKDAENWEQHSRYWWPNGNGTMQGSKGNGSAMRDTVIGAHFSDLDTVVTEARLSAEVTHFHEEAIAGSIAVAVAASVATYGSVDDFWVEILNRTPVGAVRDRIELVSTFDVQKTSNWDVVGQVGNGKSVLALDTAPFALWQAHQALYWKNITFQNCIDSIIEVGGDTDTVGAIVGGILGNSVPPTAEQIKQTEPLPEHLVVV